MSTHISYTNKKRLDLDLCNQDAPFLKPHSIKEHPNPDELRKFENAAIRRLQKAAAFRNDDKEIRRNIHSKQKLASTIEIARELRTCQGAITKHTSGVVAVSSINKNHRVGNGLIQEITSIPVESDEQRAKENTLLAKLKGLVNLFPEDVARIVKSAAKRFTEAIADERDESVGRIEKEIGEIPENVTMEDAKQVLKELEDEAKYLQRQDGREFHGTYPHSICSKVLSAAQKLSFAMQKANV